jgi:hypothetical protein
MSGWVEGVGGRRQARRFLPLLGAALLVSAEARAVVTQPGSAVALPRPVDQGEWNLVTQSWAFNRNVQVNRDFDGMDVNVENLHYSDFYPTFEDGDAITLQGMFKWQGEAIDPTLDATAAPGAFVPRCALSVELLLAGSTCEPALYWYNLPTLTGGPPELFELYQVIPKDLVTFLSCVPPLDDGFCPLAWDNVNPRELDKQLWEHKTVTLDLSGDVNYQGEGIGFVTRSTISGCTNSIHTVQEHNQRDPMDQPLVGALMYQSVLDAEAIYLAFEDTLDGSPIYQDFNDYVLRVSGCFEDPDGAGGSGGAGAGGASGTEGGAPQAGQAGASSEPEPSTGGVGTAGSPASDAGGPAGNVGGAPSSGGQPGAEPPVSSGGVGGDDATPGPASSGESSGCGCRWPRQRGHESGAFLLALVAAATLRARRRLRRAV